jgi:CheY-like chemotaxis protein
VVAMLSELGYRVLKANDAQSALSIVETGVPIDLLFTDVIMPGPLKSTELARKARERTPNLAVLFTSGYTEDAFVDSGRLDETIELLSKPYSREALGRKLRHMLANAAQRKAAGSPRPGQANRLLSAKRALRILICEDDAVIRNATADMLSSMGHQVSYATDARMALSSLKSNPADILLTDVELPDMSGATFAEYATFRFPSLAVIFASGRAPGPSLPSHTITRTLVKPFSFEQLVTAISSVTNGGTG